MKKAYITVTNEFLRGILMLPETVEVESVAVDRENRLRDEFTVFLKGDGLPDYLEWETGKGFRVKLEYEKLTDASALVPNVQYRLK